MQFFKSSATDDQNNRVTQFVEKGEIATHTWEIVQNSTVTSDAMIIPSKNPRCSERCSYSPADNLNDRRDRVQRWSTYEGR